MSPEKIKELKQKFYKECTDKDLSDSKYFTKSVNVPPDGCFQWIVDNVIKAKEEEDEICMHSFMLVRVQGCEPHHECIFCGVEPDYK